MKKKFTRFLSCVLLFVMLFSMTPLTFAAGEDTMTLKVSTASGMPGNQVKVTIDLEHNPGLSSLKFDVGFDKELTLDDVELNNEFGSYLTAPEPFTNPQTISLISPLTEIAQNGTLATLTFTIGDDARDGSTSDIFLICEDDDIFDGDYVNIPYEVVDGGVSIFCGIPGDVDGDEKVGNKDAILLFRAVAGWTNVDLDSSAVDVNGDHKVNNKDAIALFRHVAGWEGIPLVRGHELHHMAAVAKTCTVDGNIEYWHCNCGKCFTDEKANNEITLGETVIPAGHTPVTDPPVAPTYTEWGLTEGSHCVVCGEVLVAQVDIPPIPRDEYTITYYIDNNDSYLQTLTIDNPNRTSYTPDDEFYIENLKVSGYNFVGWFTAQVGGSQVTEIIKGTKRNLNLYAHWEVVEYTINFDTTTLSEVYQASDKYYVNETKTLPTPSLGGYIFMGWTNDAGDLVKTIKAGTTGNITLYANWTSKRNQTRPVRNLGTPIICEDHENGQILFAYEIGTIENVPLDLLMELTCAEGIVSVRSITKRVSLNIGKSDSVSSAVTAATTNSAAWTMAKSWNDSTSISDSVMEQTGLTREEAEEKAKTNSGSYTLNSSEGGSTVVYDENNASARLTGGEAHRRQRETDTYKGFDLSLDTKYSNTTEVNAGIEFPVEIFKVGLGAKNTSTFEIGSEFNYNEYERVQTSGTDEWNSNYDFSTSQSHSTTDEKHWNTDTSYTSSQSISEKTMVSSSLSQIIAKTTGYGKEYSIGGEESEYKSLVTADSSTNGYISALTYSSCEETIETESYTTNGEKDGYYRLVLAGTMHSFAVVGYDIASSTYYVYTYNILDDDTYKFIDYSRTTPEFNDNENGALPFEVPVFVNEYVNSKIAETDGFKIDPESGTVTEYVGAVDENGNKDNAVVVPSYKSIDNLDGSFSAVKITAISANAFKGNTDITVVKLSDYITEIPESAFEGCTSLKEIICPGVTKIGKNAFKGCTSLNKYTISKTVTELGENAFMGVNEIVVYAQNADVAKGATSSGAKKITVDISTDPHAISNVELTVPETAEHYELWGDEQEYNNLRLVSCADTTVVNGVTIIGSSNAPLDFDSDNVTLNRVSVTAPGYAMLTRGANTDIALYGANYLASTGENAVVCKNISLSELTTSVQGKLNVSGNILICGSIGHSELLSITGGAVESISESEYEQYIKGAINVTFDANGGTVSETNRTVYCGTKLGELPVPTRDYYTFAGWFTEASGGTQYTADTTLTVVEDITLFSHWTIVPYTVSWSQGANCSISVSRTSSPNADAGTGTLSNGATVYYGDVLSISYSASTGYSIGNHGETSITVTGNVTSGSIYASASANSYTYTILYRSSNGTDLGSSSETYRYGTSNTIYAPDKTGYNTPASQSVAWNATSKTITFTYTPKTVATTQNLVSNADWSVWGTNNRYGVRYSADAEYRNRTASTVQVRLKWTNTLTANTFYGFTQIFNANIGGTSTGNVTICSNSLWASQSSSARSQTVYSGWITVPLSATSTSVSISANWSASGDGVSGSWTKTISVPTY